MSKLDLSKLPDIIDNLSYLIELDLDDLQLTKLESIINGVSLWMRDDDPNSLLETFSDRLTSLTEKSHADEPSIIDYIDDDLLEVITNTHSLVGFVVTVALQPQDSIKLLSSLTGLKSDDCRLISLTETIGYLSVSNSCIGKDVKPLNLTQLDLTYNQLTSIPEAICHFSYLIGLNLECNQLTSLPESMRNLSNLEYLNIGGNQLTSLPEIFDSLSNLNELHLYDNQLTGLPKSIGNLTYLTYLSLKDNLLTTLPENIGNLPFLETLYVENNKLTRLPESIGNLPDLRWLDVSENYLNELPESINNLTNLWSIYLCDTLTDLSILQKTSSRDDLDVYYMNLNLPRRYWTKIADWKPEWLLDENNAEIRRALVQQLGYEKICEDLDAIILDT